MDKHALKLVAETVAYLASVGITPVDNPDWSRAYEGKQGSCANFRTVILGEIAPVKDPLGNPTLAVLVRYHAERESGEDLCDFVESDRRYVRLKDLKNYLDNKGWRR